MRLPSQVKTSRGKTGYQEMLPHRNAVSELTKGTPLQQTIGNYAKLTPTGASAPGTYPAIIEEGLRGVSLKNG